jgi:hypothetical protein
MLVGCYDSGATVYELAIMYDTHRTTVMSILNRTGATRRKAERKLSDTDVLLATKMYQDGSSLATVGHQPSGWSSRRQVFLSDLGMAGISGPGPDQYGIITLY